ncbi:MAG: hypothetical protein QOH41_1451 [Blastocatellia bacterium]|jgi:hypothetical protein|nr:hypothetical protein [Blastocatellia bacterium]
MLGRVSEAEYEIEFSPTDHFWLGTRAHQIEFRNVISWFFCVVLSPR